jgi:hypothetical protein
MIATVAVVVAWVVGTCALDQWLSRWQDRRRP